MAVLSRYGEARNLPLDLHDIQYASLRYVL